MLLTDGLVLLAELGAAVILPWWLTSRGGVDAMAAWGVTPAASPFGDKAQKA